ncbi:unnamed protein product [Clonostachys rosea]|uniref:N-acetyltransferase domain-containing protein n=1 Tax=Bionectria ochroleuca TaxID=29856 RepID=A0ABY6UCY4_BIOOC|nr:unnamed protein product [Clonostachys rosea]
MSMPLAYFDTHWHKIVFIIREEHSGDESAIHEVTIDAFRHAEHSSGTEATIVQELRQSTALEVSLVATLDGVIRGHVAFSRITINGHYIGWYGLGPLSVHHMLHRQGIGQSLVKEGLQRLCSLGAAGCVVLGDPAFYKRFGFRNDEELRLVGVPPTHFMVLSLNNNPIPCGTVAYHEAFSTN